MAAKTSEGARRLSLVAHRPSFATRSMIGDSQLKLPAYRELYRETVGTFGDLEALPLELVHLVFMVLDLHALSRVAQTCTRGQTVGGSLPAYRAVRQHAPRALAALGQTGLLRHHTPTTLYAALQSKACVSCEQYGAFLYLPTCERCCYHCLWRNQSLWVVPVSVARECFGLSAAQAKKLPLLHSLPGEYSVGWTKTHKRRYYLVSVGAAKRLAIMSGTSEEDMFQRLREQGEDSYKGLTALNLHLLGALLEPLGLARLMKAPRGNSPHDKFCGMASVPFPFLAADGEVEEGHWCLGCEENYRFGYMRFSAAQFDATVDFAAGLVAMRHMARSEEDMLAHIVQCSGARRLLDGSPD